MFTYMDMLNMDIIYEYLLMSILTFTLIKERFQMHLHNQFMWTRPLERVKEIEISQSIRINISVYNNLDYYMLMNSYLVYKLKSQTKEKDTLLVEKTV